MARRAKGWADLPVGLVYGFLFQSVRSGENAAWDDKSLSLEKYGSG